MTARKAKDSVALGISEEFTVLSDLANTLGDELAVLEAKLFSILRPVVPAEEAGWSICERAPDCSDFKARIKSTQTFLQGHLDFVKSINARLDL